MTELEVCDLIEFVAALCPGQKWAPKTPAAWSLVLDDVSLTDGQAAVRRIYREHGTDQEFGARRIEADAILREVRRMRAARLDSAAPETFVPPPGLTTAEYIAWHRAALRAVGDGQRIPVGDRGQLEDRPALRVLTRTTDGA